MSFGIHLIFDAYNCDKNSLSNAQGLEDLLETIPKKLGMHPITIPQIVEVGPNNKKDPGGVSGFVMIAESHISLHTFPNRGFLTADVYTCKDELDSELIVEIFSEYFKTNDFDKREIIRGTRYPEENITA